MGLRISTNVAAMSAARALKTTADEQSKSMMRLSSGSRIVVPGEDPAGKSIGEYMKAQIRSMRQAERNANDGVSMIQVAEGGLNEINNMVVRLRELAIQAASDTVGDRERGFIDQEYQSILQEVNRIANVTTFNKVPLLSGESSKNEFTFHVGIHGSENDVVRFKIQELDARTNALGLDGLNSQTIDSARDSIDRVDEALHRISDARARLGAIQNKLQSSSNNLQIYRENLTEARSRVVDTDMAEEVSQLVRTNILKDAGISVLAQANQAPMQALKLL